MGGDLLDLDMANAQEVIAGMFGGDGGQGASTGGGEDQMMMDEDFLEDFSAVDLNASTQTLAGMFLVHL